jgi:hypothetical protein
MVGCGGVSLVPASATLSSGCFLGSSRFLNESYQFFHIERESFEEEPRLTCGGERPRIRAKLRFVLARCMAAGFPGSSR